MSRTHKLTSILCLCTVVHARVRSLCMMTCWRILACSHFHGCVRAFYGSVYTHTSHISARIRAGMYIYIHTYTHRHMLSLPGSKDGHAFLRQRNCTYTHTSTKTLWGSSCSRNTTMHTQIHTLTSIYAHSYTDTRTHAHILVGFYMNALLTHIHTLPLTNTRTRTRIHTHTHTCQRPHPHSPEGLYRIAFSNVSKTSARHSSNDEYFPPRSLS